MSKKTLNAANLAGLGAARLADLLIEVSTGSADIKRRLRLELSHNLGPEELARDVRKRLASIRRSTSFVGWRKRKALIKDLSTQVEMITDKIAPDAPTEAFELLWQFIELAPSVYARCDDSRGDVGDVFRAALLRFDDIAPRAMLSPTALAGQVWDAVRDNAYGEFDGIIGLLAPSLGAEGLAHLKGLVTAHAETPVEASEDHAALQFLRDLRSSSGNYVADHKARLIKMCLQDIALAQGDTDGYIAQYSAQDLTRPSIAADVASLLMEAGRTAEALEVLEGARPEAGRNARWDEAYVGCLLALGQVEDAQTHRWVTFCDTLHVQTLRDYLKLLPDFDDVEAEDAALQHALQFGDVTRALQFFLAWPDLIHAAQLLEARAAELDGDLYHILAPAAEALRERHPLAATLAWRAMINHVLWDARSKRYGHAADHLMDCAAADLEITDYKEVTPHQTYVEQLRSQHRHKSAFWARVS